MPKLIVAMLLCCMELYAESPVKIDRTITQRKSMWSKYNTMGVVEVKWTNLSAKPIRIIEFETAFEQRLSGVAKTKRFVDVLKTPLEPNKTITSKFDENGIYRFNAQGAKPIKVFFSDGTRWLSPDQTSTKPEAEEYKELISQK